MKGLERLVELCQKEWPGKKLTFILIPSVVSDHYIWEIQIGMGGWRSATFFKEHDLVDPHAVLRTIKAQLDPAWVGTGIVGAHL